MLVEKYKELRKQRAKAFFNDNQEDEKVLDGKLKEMEAEMTKEDLDALLKSASCYQEKIYWKKKIDSLS